jgi:ribosomal protein L34E
MRKKRKNESMIEKIKKIYDHELTSIFVGKHVYDNIDNEIVTITNLVMSGSTLYAYVKKKGDTQRICKDIINLYMKPGITRFKSRECVTLKKVYKRIERIINSSRSKELKHVNRIMGNYLVDFKKFMLYIYNYT